MQTFSSNVIYFTCNPTSERCSLQTTQLVWAEAIHTLDFGGVCQNLSKWPKCYEFSATFVIFPDHYETVWPFTFVRQVVMLNNETSRPTQKQSTLRTQWQKYSTVRPTVLILCQQRLQSICGLWTRKALITAGKSTHTETSDFLLAANISVTVSKQKKHAANTLQVKHVLWKQDDYVIMVKISHQIICSFPSFVL